MTTVTDMRGRSFLTLAEFSPDELTYLLDLAAQLKADRRDGREEQKLAGKTIALIFEKDSTRTRCAFEVAAYHQGAHVTYLGPTGSHIGHKETVKDTARVLGRMYDAIEYRGFGESVADELARWAGVPVYNGLTDEWHPTQILADFLTLREHVARPLSEMSFCYMGDAHANMADSYLVGAAKMGMDLRIASPQGSLAARRVRRPGTGDRREHGCVDHHHRGRPTRRRRGGRDRHRRVGVDGRARAGVDERIGLLKPYQVSAAVMA